MHRVVSTHVHLLYLQSCPAEEAQRPLLTVPLPLPPLLCLHVQPSLVVPCPFLFSGKRHAALPNRRLEWHRAGPTDAALGHF